MSEVRLRPFWIAVFAGLVEGGLLFFVSGEGELFRSALLITLASFTLAVAGQNVRDYGRSTGDERLSRWVILVFVFALLLFAVLVVLSARDFLDYESPVANAPDWLDFVSLGAAAMLVGGTSTWIRYAHDI